ncbi:uncharacterized protein LOC135951763 [Calliphora vicina]|uniref:uncharacterized protein LOC135951763 n=1 Tax=Calliphora vicina TaxID=7373 RepID=UPI00325C279E
MYGTYAIGQLYTSEANNTYYIEFENEFTWFEAQHVCSEMNMTLVEINSNTKFLELITLIHKAEKQNNINGTYLWTGGIRNELPVDNFVWYSTGEQFNYTNWYNSYPNSRDDPKACLEIVAVFDWQWRNYECSSRSGFGCEEKTTRQILQNLKQKLQTEIEKNLNLQKELQQQQDEHQEQLRKLNEQNLEAQHQFQLQSHVIKQQKLKLEEDLQAEIIKQNNLKQQLESQQKLQDQLQEQIIQLKEEQKDVIKLREYMKINKDTTDLKQGELQITNRLISSINAS